jgi:hypothetical protein
MPRLRTGLPVVRRDDRHLQVGIDPPWRVVVPDEPDVRRLLADLAAGRTPSVTTAVAHRVLRDLVAADLVIDGDSDTDSDRSRIKVSVSGSERLVAEAVRLLQASGCAGPTRDAAVALVLADGEPRRESVDEHVRDSRPHLAVSGTQSGYLLGPFVVPGRTACLRCVDAHRGERDPRRAVVVEQLGDRALAPPDPALQALTAAWAVRDVLTFADGGRPSTWSATVEIGPDLVPMRREWARHPHCGCSWVAAPVAG